jgi:hypothetical protein
MSMRLSTRVIAMAALLAPAAGWCADSPSYQGEVLFIPRVDTPQQVAQFQNGALRRLADGSWSLLSIQALEEGDLTALAGVNTVAARVMESVPSAVYLQVNGAEARCGFSGRHKVHQRRTGSHFEVLISASLPSQGACATMMYPYRITVPLDVYDLPMGTYTFSVNGLRGMFTLQRANRFADDCGLSQNCSPQ